MVVKCRDELYHDPSCSASSARSVTPLLRLEKLLQSFRYCGVSRLQSPAEDFDLDNHHNARFPAAFQDALTAYAYLIDIGVRSSDIVLSGDSAGGHLVVMLLRYFSDNPGPLLGEPRAALLWSPWLNLDVNPDEIDRSRNGATDFVLGIFVRWAVEAFVPPGMDLMERYLSALYHSFSTATRIWIQVGEQGVLHQETMLFANRMAEMESNRVEILEAPCAPHDIFLAGGIIGVEREIEDATKHAARFLKAKFS
ncbi:MAG: hypothetical protein Q9219_004433 [cf. Caloplaca sp. 3 TL-2023]